MNDRLEIATRILQGKSDVIHCDTEKQQGIIIAAIAFADMMIDIEGDAEMWEEYRKNEMPAL